MRLSVFNDRLRNDPNIVFARYVQLVCSWKIEENFQQKAIKLMIGKTALMVAILNETFL